MKKVNEQEFREFIINYPRPLEASVFGAGEPPQRQWNDFALGVWPTSVVATMSLERNCEYRIEDKESKQ